MPAPNDLTPEEEQAFIEHGVQPAGPGMEPTGEPNPGTPEPPAAPEPVIGTVPVARDPSGRFAPLPAPTEPAATEPPAAEPSAPPPGFVPHQALHEARMREQQARQMAQLAQTRMNAMLASQQAQQPEAMPDLATDPVGYMQAMEQRIATFETQRAEEAQNRQIEQAIDNDENLFRAAVPDYDAAAAHYVRSRAQELMNFYPPEQAQQVMMNEARQMAQEAWRRGTPAAQIVYQMAQARGYQPGQAAPTPFAAPQALQQPAAGGLTAGQRVQAVQAGQQATRTLSVGGGSAASATLNAEALLAMSDEDFAEYMKLGQKGANDRFAGMAGF